MRRSQIRVEQNRSGGRGDLLYPAADFAEVDAFIARDGQLAEITAKRQFSSGCVTPVPTPSAGACPQDRIFASSAMLVALPEADCPESDLA
jgi:hypothetical protein